MKKKGIAIVAALSSMVLLTIILLSFYAVPYIKGNHCITYVNKNSFTDEYPEENWIAYSDFASLRIVDEQFINDNTYVSIHTKPQFSFISWNKLCITYDIVAEINDWETWECVEKCQQQRKIFFTFSDCKWIVDKVNT